MTKALKNPAAGVFAVVLAYALFAGLWILLSDHGSCCLTRRWACSSVTPRPLFEPAWPRAGCSSR